MTEIDAITKGFERIAQSLAVPQGKRLWNAEAVAEYFGVSSSAKVSRETWRKSGTLSANR